MIDSEVRLLPAMGAITSGFTVRQEPRAPELLLKALVTCWLQDGRYSASEQLLAGHRGFLHSAQVAQTA